MTLKLHSLISALLWITLRSINRPCGKEGTEVQIAQNKGKLSPKIEEISNGKASIGDLFNFW